jgi:hypothetical protein
MAKVIDAYLGKMALQSAQHSLPGAFKSIWSSCSIPLASCLIKDEKHVFLVYLHIEEGPNFKQTHMIHECGKTLNTSQHVQGAFLSFQSVSYIPHNNRYTKVNEYVLNTHIQMHIYIFAHRKTNLNTKTNIKRSSLINKYVYVAHISRHTPK